MNDHLIHPQDLVRGYTQPIYDWVFAHLKEIIIIVTIVIFLKIVFKDSQAVTISGDTKTNRQEAQMIGFHGKNTKNGKITGNMKPIAGEHSFNPLLTRLLSFILSISIFLTVAAPFAEPQIVEANWVTRTIGALITSLALQSGAANIDTNYLNYVNDPNNTVMQIEIPNDGGVTSLPADLASQIDTALESAPVGVKRTVRGMETTQAEILISLQDYIQNNGLISGDFGPKDATGYAWQNIAASAQQLQANRISQPAMVVKVGAFSGMASYCLELIISQMLICIKNY